VVEDLSKRREPMPNMSGAPRHVAAPRATRLAHAPPPNPVFAFGAAIYFISPTERSVRQLIEDFAGPLQMYKRAHVFFSNRAWP
jgi:hypothetical protein